MICYGSSGFYGIKKKLSVGVKIILFFLSCFINTSLNAQIELYNNSLKDSTLKILYMGYDNMIEVIGAKQDKKYSIKASKSEVSDYVFKDKSNKFIIRGRQKGEDSLFIYENNKLVKGFKYLVQNIESIKCILGNYLTMHLTKKQILEKPYLSLYIPDCQLKHNSFVYSFELSRITENKIISLYDTIPEMRLDSIFKIDPATGKEYFETFKNSGVLTSNSGNSFTDYQKKQILNMKKGEKLLIERVKIFAPCPKLIPGLVITIN